MPLKSRQLTNLRRSAGMQQALVPPVIAPDDPTDTATMNKRPSNQRFRSFAERYVIERAKLFSTGTEIEDAHKATLAARTIYNMVKEVGRTLQDDQ